MDVLVKDGPEDDLTSPSNVETSTTTSRSQSHKTTSESTTPQPPSKSRSRRSETAVDAAKRRCVSTACIACRRRKSKCDGILPACAACASVYNTECIYDPNSDHRRKGVYKKNEENLKTKNSTLHTLIQAVLNYPEDDVPALIRLMRTCESLDKVAELVAAKERGEDVDLDEDIVELERGESNSPTFEAQLSRKMGTLKLNDGRILSVGGTSNLIFGTLDGENSDSGDDDDFRRSNPITSWSTVTADPDLVTHILNHYFTWHYTFFTILPKASFYKQFLQGQPPEGTRRKTEYCSPLLVNTLLSLGCHFTSSPGTREVPTDASTAGDHFFKEAKRLLYEGDELAKPSLATVQALALMSVREAGCAREANGWVYSGMAFRMSCDLGLSFQTPSGLVFNRTESFGEEEEDARRVTFWGCFQIDKCWSNYLGRMPQFQLSDNVTVPRYIVVPIEDADTWSPYSDSGFSQAHAQPGRVRAVALQISVLCEISSDIIKNFYNPQSLDKPVGKQTELKQLSEIHTRLEDWRRNLAKELEPKEGALPSTLVMHMFFQLLYIHLFRPFLKYTQATSPLPSHVSPRKLCTQAAGMISKLMRLYKRSHGLRQIVNFAIYVVHSACTIHLLNLPEKTARRDIIHGVKHLEEMAEGWLVARRTLSVLSMQAKKWKVELPDEAAAVLMKTDAKFGIVPSADTPISPPQVAPSPVSSTASSSVPPRALPTAQNEMGWQQPQQSGPGVGDSMQMHGIDNVATTNAMSSIAQNDFSFSAAMSTPWTQQLQMQPATALPSVQLDYSPRSQGPIPARQSTLKRMSTGHAIGQSQQQQQQGATPQLMLQTPLMQPPTTPQHTQTQRAMAQPRRPTALRSLTQGNTPAFSSDMFGGVEALLREGQEWWMKDQSHDLASGFGNWHNSIDFGGTGFGAAQQQQQQQQSRGQPPVQQQGRPSTTTSQSQQIHAQRYSQQAQSQPRPQQQQYQQSQSPQQYQQPYQQQSFQQQQQQQHAGQQTYHTLRHGSVPELFSTPGFPAGQHSQMQGSPSGSGSVPGMASSSGGVMGGDVNMYGASASAGQQTYDFGGLGTVYDEEEWYQ